MNAGLLLLLLQAWCKEQMIKFQGQDDLTLVRFLMSCSSTGEVAEYLTAYLGKSADVSKFTSEFLRRKYAEASGKKVRSAAYTTCSAISALSRSGRSVAPCSVNAVCDPHC